MPQESNLSNLSAAFMLSPCKSSRGCLKSNNNTNNNNSQTTNVHDYELAHRKAEEAASRRNQAAEWLRKMDNGASGTLPKEPSEEEFCLALRNGLILCNVLNKVNPGAVHKGGSSGKVVDCILCLKGFYEWTQAGGVGVWRYGGTVKITSFPKGSPPSMVGSESADESFDDSEASSQYEQLLEFLHFSTEISVEESKTANALTFLFDHFGLLLLQAYVRESNNGYEELPLNTMKVFKVAYSYSYRELSKVIDTLLSKVVKDFSELLASQGQQLGLFLKKILRSDVSKSEFIEAIKQYLAQRKSSVSGDFSKFCICGGKREIIRQAVVHSNSDAELINLQRQEIQNLKLDFQETKTEVKQIHTAWEEDLKRLVHVYGKELVSGSILKGCLHLVDLAGSERVDKSEAVGERLKEAQHINKSLSALGDVVAALAQKSAHVPYRNSKLTQVLQDSLGGHAKTLMFVHINPEVTSIGETVSTLKFAERVASIELGAARSNKETGEIRELKEEISNLKQALERKESELEQLKNGNVRSTTEPQTQRTRAISPFRLPRFGKPETENMLIQARSCSSGKQRKSRFPSALADKETVLKMPILVEENLVGSGKPRSLSPPIRRSISTDRGAHMRNRVKPEITIENLPTIRTPYPARVPANTKTTATDNNVRLLMSSQEPGKQDNNASASYNLQNVGSRKVYIENEEEQLFRQALNVRQGGIRKSKVESKSKSKHQLPARVGVSMLSDLETTEKTKEARKSDFSEPENEQQLIRSPVFGSALKMKRLQKSSIPRNSQNLEPRAPVQPLESFLPASRHENKIPNIATRQTKESGDTSVPEFRRSRSTPRGKFFILP
ncbi:hypothetical protein ACFE04_004688 [Oxalis oulophora]